MKKTVLLSVSSLIGHYISLIIIFLVPIFFLPITEDFFAIQKMTLVVLASLILLVIFSINILFVKKLKLFVTKIDLAVLFFLLSVLLSTVFASYNKLQSLVKPGLGLLSVFVVVLFYFLLSRSVIRVGTKPYLKMLKFSALIFTITSIVFSFSPFKNMNLPSNLSPLKSPIFNLAGFYTDNLFLLGLFLVLTLDQVIKMSQEFIGGHFNNKKKIGYFINLIFTILLAFALSMYVYQIFNNKSVLMFPPFKVSWYACLEIMKSLNTLFFGIGVDNYSIAFTMAKDISYNALSFWSLGAFEYASSFILQIFTEVGLLGIASFIFMVWFFLKSAKGHELVVFYLFASLFFIPLSFVSIFVLFSLMALLSFENITDTNKMINFEIDLPPFSYIILAVLMIIFSGILGSFFVRYYLSEVNYARFLYDNFTNEIDRYNILTSAIDFAPFNERYFIAASKFNLKFVGVLVNKLKDKKDLSDQEKLLLNQLVNNSIIHAETVIRLNPYKYGSWINLSEIHSGLIGVNKDSDKMAIESLNQASNLDPYNPAIKMRLGNVYYTLGDYDMAISYFNQALAFKSDLPSALYNLAWSYYRKGLYDRAKITMQRAVSIYSAINDKNSFKKATEDLSMFNKKLGEEKKLQESRKVSPDKIDAVEKVIKVEGENSSKRESRIDESDSRISSPSATPVIIVP